jgi:hypothetical protein
LSEQIPANDKWSLCRVSLFAGFRAQGVTQGGRSPTEVTSCAPRKIYAAAFWGV